jgi:hypothetical protein
MRKPVVGFKCCSRMAVKDTEEKCCKLTTRLLKPETPVYHNGNDSLPIASFSSTEGNSLYMTLDI